MRGETAPAMEDAVNLLRSAAFRVQDEKRPRVFFAERIVNTEAEAEEIRKTNPRQKVISLESHPEKSVEMTRMVRDSIPFSAQIDPPRTYPVTRSGLWRALLGTRPSETRMADTEKKLANADPEMAARVAECLNRRLIVDEVSFWWVAEDLGKFFPRFARFYDTPHESKVARPKRQRSMDGKFRKAESRAADGTFRKKGATRKK